MEKEINTFLVALVRYKKELSLQAYRTIAGQARHGDIKGAEKGLKRILKRGIMNEKQKNAAGNG